MVNTIYVPLEQFAEKTYEEVVSSIRYTITPKTDIRVTYYLHNGVDLTELNIVASNETVRSYGPSQEKEKQKTQPRWPGDGYSFVVSEGKLSQREALPVIGDPNNTDADNKAALFLHMSLALLRVVAEDAGSFTGYFGAAAEFAAGTPYAFTIQKREPQFRNMLNHPKNINNHRHILPHIVETTRAIPIQHLIEISNAWITKFSAMAIAERYKTKGYNNASIYLTLYLPQLDYRNDSNKNAPSAMVLIRAANYGEACKLSASANKIMNPVTEGAHDDRGAPVDIVPVRAWQFLDTPPDSSDRPQAICNLMLRPEIYIGQQKVFRLVVVTAIFIQWKQPQTQKSYPPLPSLEEGSSGAEILDP
jgi:hypothetical protein